MRSDGDNFSLWFLTIKRSRYFCLNKLISPFASVMNMMNGELCTWGKFNEQGFASLNVSLNSSKEIFFLICSSFIFIGSSNEVIASHRKI